MGDFGDSVVHVGNIFFHPGSRQAIPSFAELQAYMQSHTERPIVIRPAADGQVAGEQPHLVLARFITNSNDEVGVDDDGRAIIILFTMAVSAKGKSFDPATHFKEGRQREGVDILNWNEVNFEPEYAATSLAATYRRIYDDILPFHTD